MTTTAGPPRAPGKEARGDRTPGSPRRGAEGPDLFDGRGVLSMFRSVKSPRPGTMPAGFVLVIVACGLLVAMFVNADATARKSKANLACDGCWRQTVSSAIADFSDFFRFTSPRQSVDAALAKNQEAGQSTEDLLAEQRQQVASGDPAAAGAEATPTASSDKPVIRTPTPDDPLRVWVGGDSITGDFGRSFARVSSSTKLFTPTHDYKVSSGLTRPDYFNWPEHLVRDVVPSVDPDVVVIMFGANDAQNMPAWKDTKASVRFSDEWLAEYRKRVADTMDLLKSPDNDRLVIWTGALIMGPNTGLDGMAKLNYIYWSEAQKRPWVDYFDSWSYFADADGSYRASLPMADGQTKLLRASDNIHLSGAGADRLAWAVLGRLGKEIDLSQSQAIPPVEQLAPPTVTERTEVPEPS
ncbi:MAG: hypothetical protein R2726_15945 [Acidimicrobiales bacterium]